MDGLMDGLIVLIIILGVVLVGGTIWALIIFFKPPKITEGEVYEKEFIPAYNQMMIIPIVISNGKTTTTMMIPYMYYYPDSWVIKIKDFQDNKWVTEDFYVSEEIYNAVTIGSEFKYQPDRGDLNDQPYTREEVEEKES